jgi:FkbM family methyltransferase
LALWAWKAGLLEDVELELLPQFIEPGMTVVDVGANVGLFTLAMSRLVGPSGRVVAFEPDPVNLGMLRRNLEANQAANVDLVPKAVGEHTGRARLFIRREHSGDSRIFPYRYSHASIEIEMVSLDDYFPPGTRVDFIKIDTQGAECQVLAGMRRVVADNPTLVSFCEFAPATLAEAGCAGERFFRLLEEMALEMALISEEDGRLEPVEQAQLEALGEWQHSNLVLRRRPGGSLAG